MVCRVCLPWLPASSWVVSIRGLFLSCVSRVSRLNSPVKLLFIGDIVGQPGRRAVAELLPKLREQHSLDFVIANGENSAGGSGITPKTAGEIFSAGVDVITSGDHLWDQKEVMELLANEKRFLRPLNYPPGTPGQGSGIFQVQSPKSKAPKSDFSRCFECARPRVPAAA